MATLSSGKIAEVIFENMLESYEHQDKMLDLCEFFKPDAATMQNAGNIVWRPVQQHAPIITGWDLSASSNRTGIIEETYSNSLSDPRNDFVELRADDMRDMEFWKRRGVQSGMQQATELNNLIAGNINLQGSLFYQNNDTSGFDFISEAQAIMDERQGYNSGMRSFILNNRDSRRFAEELAGRNTLQGRPEMVWKKGQIAQNVAGFDIYTASFLPQVRGGTAGNLAVNGANQRGTPVGATTDQSGQRVQNVDYRQFVLTADGSGFAGVQAGDKVTIAGVNSIGLASKTDTSQLMTFSVVAKGTNTLVLWPKPINNADTTNLNVLQRAYSNTTGAIADNAAITILNTTARRSNLFFDKDAVEVMGGSVPVDLFSQFNGYKVITERMANGQEIYMLYAGNIDNMTFRFRVFTWYGITVRDPQRAGVAVSTAT